MKKTFSDYQLNPYIIEGLTQQNIIYPTEIQEAVMPSVFAGDNLIGQSQTGSGKTYAFLLPLLHQLNVDQSHIQYVITAPSRELAEQIYHALIQITQYAPEPIYTYLCVGGTDKQKLVQKFEHRQPHIIIGTPGRILDMVDMNVADIHKVSCFVIDEADMTLDLGFLTTVDQIAAKVDKKCQFLVFSATIPQKLQPFLNKYLERPKWIQLSTQETPVQIEHWLIETPKSQINSTIYELLTIGQPYLVLIFANTKKTVIELHHYLKHQGLKVAMMHGDLDARERKKVMKEIRQMHYQFIVATDLAARGIDIDGVSHVINAEIPQDLDFWIHRVGRTGRGAYTGISITLYQPEEEPLIQQLETKYHIHFSPKIIRQGEVLDSYDRNRRMQRKNKKTEVLNPTTVGFIKKQKTKKKPGYKKKIKREILEEQRKQRKQARRQEQRKQRKQRKTDFLT